MSVQCRGALRPFEEVLALKRDWSADGRMPPVLAFPGRAAFVSGSAARNLGLGIGGACCINKNPSPERISGCADLQSNAH
jgi:hypothetical protein